MPRTRTRLRTGVTPLASFLYDLQHSTGTEGIIIQIQSDNAKGYNIFPSGRHHDDLINQSSSMTRWDSSVAVKTKVSKNKTQHVRKLGAYHITLPSSSSSTAVPSTHPLSYLPSSSPLFTMVDCPLVRPQRRLSVDTHGLSLKDSHHKHDSEKDFVRLQSLSPYPKNNVSSAKAA